MDEVNPFLEIIASVLNANAQIKLHNAQEEETNLTIEDEDASNNNLGIKISDKNASGPVIEEHSDDESPAVLALKKSGLNIEELQSDPASVPQKEILTSFSRSGSTSQAAQSFFQPEPDNFFKSFPLPFYYMPKGTQSAKGFNLVKFITAGVTSNLKSIGVDELDCKEYVENWLSQRKQRRWTQSLRRPDEVNTESSEVHPLIQAVHKLALFTAAQKPEGNESELADILNLSKPNSSLLGLNNDNSEMNKFLTTMDEIKCHLKNATCTLLQASILLDLPHLKLLSGHQLDADSSNCQTFVEEWVQIVFKMSAELQLDAPKEANVMVSRELYALRSDSKNLYKLLKKFHRKFKAVFMQCDSACKKSLGMIHPKGQASSTYGALNERILTSDTIKFAPVPLHGANITVTDLFKNHVCFSQSAKKNLLYKVEIDKEWSHFSDLPYNIKRELFLSVVEDLRWTLKVPSTTARHINELCIKGYPESIHSKIKASLNFLQKVGKQEDLVVLSKVTIVTQINSFHETMARLLRTLRDTMGLAKYFYKTIQSNTYIPFGKKKAVLKKAVVKKICPPRSSNESLVADFSTPLAFDRSCVKVLLPFPISTDPIEDQFFMSSV